MGSLRVHPVMLLAMARLFSPALMLLFMCTSPAAAAIVHFINPEPGQPGHFAWELDVLGPPSWLDITLSPEAQTNAPSTSAVVQMVGGFGNLHHPEVGFPGLHALVLGDLGTLPYTAGLLFGDPVVEDASWGFLASTAHYGGEEFTNFPEGETRYIGVLTMDGNYGWIEVIREGWSLNAISWAYETQPGINIYAGQVPAPGALPLLLIGAIVGGRRRR